MAKSSTAVPIVVCLALVLSIVVAFATLLATVAAEDAADAASAPPAEAPVPAQAELRKMKVRELKAILDKKGPDAACIACTSKGEYIERIQETKSWPDVQPSPDVADGPSVDDLHSDDPAIDPERLARLKEMLKASGIDTSKLFSNTDGSFNDKELERQFKQFEAMRKKDSMEAEAKLAEETEQAAQDPEVDADDEHAEL